MFFRKKVIARGSGEFERVLYERGDDGTRVTLSIEGLQEGHIHELHAGGIRDANGDLLLHKEAYYTIELSSIVLPRFIPETKEPKQDQTLANLSFGLLSTFLPEALISGTPLAAAVSGFIAFGWAVRLVIQFAYFDRTDMPAGTHYRLAEAALILLFFVLMLIYGAAAFANFGAPTR